jgi:hypothetical protein
MSDLTPAIDFQTMYDGLEKFEQSTSYEAQDLTTAVYERDSEFGSLNFPNRSKLELTEWSARQLCRKAGIPFGVFRKASAGLSQELLAEFSKGVKDPQVKLAVKSFGKKESLRGILPVSYPDIRDSDILKALGQVNEPFVIQQAGWLDKVAEPLRRTRVVFPRFNANINGEDLLLGLDITSSELGAGDFQINLLLFRLTCANGAIATYEKKPYFVFNYTGQFVFDVGDLMMTAMKRLSADIQAMMDKVTAARATNVDLQSAALMLDGMMKNNLLKKGVVIKALATLEKDGCQNLWDVVNAVTSSARGFRDALRLRYESAAGGMLGLTFTRAQQEEEFAKTAKDIVVPPALLAQVATHPGNGIRP